jgi:pantoate--beta-alanine ligase
MTMGALHAGHAALIESARRAATALVVTIFVNPLQFGSGEDLARYPRTLDADVAVAAALGADAVFAPDVHEVYPGGEPVVTVGAGPLASVLEGASRPGHFDGVLTVVTKLLHLTRPRLAFFGQKDAQQLVLVRRLVADLDFPVQVVAVPTVREPDGLALSSRNVHLDAAARGSALALSRALHAGEARADNGPDAVRAAARSVLDAEPGIDLDYLALVDPGDLADVATDAVGPALLLVAARIGTTRLIDNVPLVLGGSS